LYQAVWEGQGGDLDRFPSSRGIMGPLNGRELSLLLSTVDTDDDQFWRRIGRGLRLEQVVEISPDTNRRSLDRLIEANLDRLMARGARVFGRSEPPTSEGAQFSWEVRGQCLLLRGGGWNAYFAAKVA